MGLMIPAGQASLFETSASVAALYVLAESSPYRELDDVDLWPEARDARGYRGPAPGVFHPPCGPHSKKWSHASKKPWEEPLAPFAVWQVRMFGGILEHPAESLIWSRPELGLPLPGAPEDAWGGFTVEVQLAWWGASVAKPTWLYFVGLPRDAVLAAIPPPCAPAPPPRDPGVRTDDNRPRPWSDAQGPTERARTPPRMARWLVSLARGAIV